MGFRSCAWVFDRGIKLRLPSAIMAVTLFGSVLPFNSYPQTSLPPWTQKANAFLPTADCVSHVNAFPRRINAREAANNLQMFRTGLR
jgi:hypothetical protein